MMHRQKSATQTWAVAIDPHDGPMVARHGFTIIELLIVTSIIGLLTAIVLPAVQSSRSAARRVQCASNLRQLALAAQAFHTSWEHFPPGLEQHLGSSAPRYRGTSLFAYLLPFIEQPALARDWDFDQPLNNTQGGEQAKSAAVIEVYLCPSDRITHNPVLAGERYFGLTSYGGNGGSRSYYPDFATADGVFHTTGPASRPKPHQVPVSLSMIRDGAGNTILLGERSHADENFETFAAMSWTESLGYLGRWAAIGGNRRIADVTLSSFAPINYRLTFGWANRHLADPPLNGSRDFQTYEDRRLCAYGSEHPGGANFAFADGAVRFMDDGTEHGLLRALCTRAGREPAMLVP